MSIEPGEADAPEIAFYYPGHLWYEHDWIKTLLLFFDGIGVLIPEYKQSEPEAIDPVLAAPLRDQGLLHYLVADQVVDKAATEQLATSLTEFISSGALDVLAQEQSAFHAISMSRMGYYGDTGLAQMLFEELRARGLAQESRDGVSIPLHPMVRYLILVLLAQILRPAGASMGLDLSPATDQPKVVKALTEFLALPSAPSSGHVIASDLLAVSVDLSAVPLDEVLQFRADHRDLHRKYTRSVRAFVRELGVMPESMRADALRDREEELKDLANDLQRLARSAWKRPASFALGIAGASWALAFGDPVSALVGAGATVLRASASSPQADAFSYLFAAHKSYQEAH